jgi:hypothetical protein
MPKRKAKPDSHYADQPAVAAILKMLENRRGATVAEIAKARGLLQLHTVRSVLSRLGSKAGLELTRTRVEGRGGLCIAPRPRRPPLNLGACLSNRKSPNRGEWNFHAYQSGGLT